MRPLGHCIRLLPVWQLRPIIILVFINRHTDVKQMHGNTAEWHQKYIGWNKLLVICNRYLLIHFSAESTTAYAHPSAICDWLVLQWIHTLTGQRHEETWVCGLLRGNFAATASVTHERLSTRLPPTPTHHYTKATVLCKHEWHMNGLSAVAIDDNMEAGSCWTGQWRSYRTQTETLPPSASPPERGAAPAPRARFLKHYQCSFFDPFVNSIS